MKVFRLNHVLKADQQLVVKSVKDGKVSQKITHFKIGTTYKLGDYDETSLRAKTTRVAYRPESEEYLKNEGVDYEVVLCKACGGKKKKLELKTFEIFEVDPKEWEEVK